MDEYADHGKKYHTITELIIVIVGILEGKIMPPGVMLEMGRRNFVTFQNAQLQVNFTVRVSYDWLTLLQFWGLRMENEVG